MARTITDLLEQRAADTADGIFLRFEGGDLSFEHTNDMSARIAGGLDALGVSRGATVAVLLPNCAEFVLCWFAAARLGAVHAPINTAFRGGGLAHALTVSEARVVIVDDSLLDALSAVVADVPGVHTVVVRGAVATAAERLPGCRIVGMAELAAADAVAPAAVDPSEIAMVLFTSGTTGRSKACMLSHGFVVGHAELFVQHLGIRREDVLYCPFPLFHADAAIFTVAPALVSGATAAIGLRFTTHGFWDEARAFRATVFDFMGATLAMLYRRPPDASDPDNGVRMAWGVPMPDFASRFEARFGLRLVEVFGLSDTGIVAYHPLDEPRRGACGRVVPPFEIAIFDNEGHALPCGAVGEIAIRADEPDMLMRGYLGMPQETLDAFRDEWFHTGDRGRLDEDGYLYFVGRAKDVIRRRGENISAREVEEVIGDHPAVREVAAFGVPSDLTEEDVMVSVVLEPGAQLDVGQLLEFCDQRMARHMRPRYLDLVDQLPRTPTEKVEKYRLSSRGVTDATLDLERAARA